MARPKSQFPMIRDLNRLAVTNGWLSVDLTVPGGTNPSCCFVKNNVVLPVYIRPADTLSKFVLDTAARFCDHQSQVLIILLTDYGLFGKLCKTEDDLFEVYEFSNAIDKDKASSLEELFEAFFMEGQK